MRRFAWWEQEFVANIATAVKWRAEELIEAGMPFDEAKRQAIAKAEPTWKHLLPEIRQAALNVCHSIGPADLSKRTHRIVKARFLADVEAHRGHKAGRIERAFFAVTGMVW